MGDTAANSLAIALGANLGDPPATLAAVLLADPLPPVASDAGLALLQGPAGAGGPLRPAAA